ncbi:hypothetical protein IWX90DRAFT_107921 [Phyllosticta citrichinensis]|uniref:Uncharacterized protein n=1 Tax=Phyllosticta citrichinensis TaxID=1130410 RepID=A0ABR1Y2Y7_9PEZI
MMGRAKRCFKLLSPKPSSSLRLAREAESSPLSISGQGRAGQGRAGQAVSPTWPQSPITSLHLSPSFAVFRPYIATKRNEITQRERDIFVTPTTRACIHRGGQPYGPNRESSSSIGQWQCRQHQINPETNMAPVDANGGPKRPCARLDGNREEAPGTNACGVVVVATDRKEPVRPTRSHHPIHANDGEERTWIRRGRGKDERSSCGGHVGRQGVVGGFEFGGFSLSPFTCALLCFYYCHCRH